MSFALVRSRSESRTRLRSCSQKPASQRARSSDSTLSVRRRKVDSFESEDEGPERMVTSYRVVQVQDEADNEDNFELQLLSDRSRWVKRTATTLVPKRHSDVEIVSLNPAKKICNSSCPSRSIVSKKDCCIPRIQIQDMDFDFEERVIRPYNMSLRNPLNNYNYGYDSDDDYPPYCAPRVIEIAPRGSLGRSNYDYGYGYENGLAPLRAPRTPIITRRGSLLRNTYNYGTRDDDDDLSPYYAPQRNQISPRKSRYISVC